MDSNSSQDGTEVYQLAGESDVCLLVFRLLGEGFDRRGSTEAIACRRPRAERTARRWRLARPAATGSGHRRRF